MASQLRQRRSCQCTRPVGGEELYGIPNGIETILSMCWTCGNSTVFCTSVSQASVVRRTGLVEPPRCSPLLNHRHLSSQLNGHIHHLVQELQLVYFNSLLDLVDLVDDCHLSLCDHRASAPAVSSRSSGSSRWSSPASVLQRAFQQHILELLLRYLDSPLDFLGGRCRALCRSFQALGCLDRRRLSLCNDWHV